MGKVLFTGNRSEANEHLNEKLQEKIDCIFVELKEQRILETVEKEKVTLILNSIERSDEIDINRAKAAKQRAEERLENKDDDIDIARAKASLMRAIVRIDVSENN